MEKEIVEGYISNYIFESEDSLYKVVKVTTIDNDDVIVVGNFPRLLDGLNYRFIGQYKDHTRYGIQFVCDSYQKSDSINKEGLITYLSGDKFKGIGPKMAEAIVDKLGTNAIDEIIKDKNVLNGIKGLKESKIELIYETIKTNYLADNVFIRLYGFGLTAKMANKIYQRYGVDSANVVEDNPYILINEVEGFGFKRCDNLAFNLGFKDTDPKRIRAAILYTLNFVCYQYGYTFLTKEQLINSSYKLLNNNPLIDISIFNTYIDELIKENKLIFEDDRIFEPILYKAEVELSKKIIKMKNTKTKLFSDDDVKEALFRVEELLNINYTPLQQEAIINSLSNKLSIITGGPGTGKSTILKGILYTYASLYDASVTDDKIRMKVLLASPTGRAAKRMCEVTGFNASTIHKALGYNYDNGFAYNEYNLLSQSLIIVDEASMVDVELARNLFNALNSDSQVILVGDSNQLPSVSPGNVLLDLINSNIFKTTKLNQIMRQAKDSNIVELSHMVLNERINYSIFNNKADLFYYNYDSKNTIDFIIKIMDKYVSLNKDIYKDIQILAPMYAGACGIDEINKVIQEKFNGHEEKMVIYNDVAFKVNDKVLQLKNDSVLDIMNGDIGKIIDILKIEDKTILMIDFDGKIVSYPASDLENLKLGYAISIHKSQGSEFDNVILPILPSYGIMLKKKIIYTAITRAKKKLIVIGKLDSLEKAIHTPDSIRQTGLYNRLISKNVDLGKKIFDPEIPFDTLGEYDMEGITPYSFMD